MNATSRQIGEAVAIIDEITPDTPSEGSEINSILERVTDALGLHGLEALGVDILLQAMYIKAKTGSVPDFRSLLA